MTSAPQRSQRGISLLVTLVMLVVMTLLVVSAIRAGNANLKTTANLQLRQEAAHAAQDAIEQTLSNMANFSTPVARAISVAVDGGSTAYTVNVAPPTCLFAVPVGGYSIEFLASAPNDTFWDVKASTTDAITGASATVHQGVRIRVDPTVSC
ncbi:MAG: hypothetical protein NVSMB34_00100 [Variovorax sp.]